MKLVRRFTILLALLLVFQVVACTGHSTEPFAPTPQPPEFPLADTTPPETTLTSCETSNPTNITFTWKGSDNKTPEAILTYSYYLQGHDTVYSPFTSDTTKTYTNLPEGIYTFYVKSRDAAGNIDPSPTSKSFEVATLPAPSTLTPSTVPPEKDKMVVPVTPKLLILPGSDVSYIAVGCDGSTIYAVDAINAKLYRSDQGGYGWENKSRGIAGPATWNGLAIAPDNPKVAAVVTNASTEVYFSSDSGTNFYATGLATKLAANERIKCIAISPAYGRGGQEIAVGTATGNGGGRVWVNIISSFPTGWRDVSTGATGWLPGAPPILKTDVFAVEYAPGFAGDGALLAIVATGPPPDTNDTYVYAGVRDLASYNTIWNSFPGYPVEICQSGQDTPGTPLTYANLALPSDYSGTIPAWQHIYTSWRDNPPGNPNDDVYRIDSTVCYRLNAPEAMCSLAYYGTSRRGKLLAGAAMPTGTAGFSVIQTYCTLNPQSNYPDWQKSLKPPTGPAQARVGWSPDGRVAYCGTSSTTGGSHDQSAFSRSTNDGQTWNQIGLIDN